MIGFVKIVSNFLSAHEFCLSLRKPGWIIRVVKEAQMAHQPKELPEILRWGGWRNPNPPDPWLELILEIGDPQIRQAAVSELVKMNIATARIQGEFWTGIQRAIGKG